MMAAYNGNLRAVGLLLSIPGIKLDVRDMHGDTALMHIVRGDSPRQLKLQIISLLIKFGADASVLNCKRMSFMDIYGYHKY